MVKPSTPDNRSLEEQELPAIEFVAQGSFSIFNPETATLSSTWQAADFQLGEHRELIHAEGVDAVRSHTLALLEQAQHSLCIYSYDLAAWLYNHSCIQQACSRLLTAHPKHSLRILLQDTSRITREGHALLVLCQRLSSRCSIRKVNFDYDHADANWLIADDCGVLIRTQQQPRHAMIHYHNPARVLQNQRLFDAMWEVSFSDINLRSMPL